MSPDFPQTEDLDHAAGAARLSARGEVVSDRLTGLVWTRDAAVAEFPLSWQESLEFVRGMNHRGLFGFSDWRLPNRRELFSLFSHASTNPCLPEGHPFANVFSGYYWTSSTCARLTNQAWCGHLGGARLVKGMKHAAYMLWPVRNIPGPVVARTGQKACYDGSGMPISCSGAGQDGEIRSGGKWPHPRFVRNKATVEDRLTARMWTRSADFCRGPVSWEEAGKSVDSANAQEAHGFHDWRLPGIRELESLIDLQMHSPALPQSHSFVDLADFYWAETTSAYDARYAWALYLVDGMVGVGFKPGADFHVWLVRTASSARPTLSRG